MSVTKRERITTTTMEPHVTGDSLTYVEKSYEGYAWRCDGCGLVWDKKHLATNCAGRNHVAHFEDGPYGVRGPIVNGVLANPGYTMTRRALRREGGAEVRAEAEAEERRRVAYEAEADAEARLWGPADDEWERLQALQFDLAAEAAATFAPTCEDDGRHYSNFR